jgi:hypothetical protein
LGANKDLLWDEEVHSGVDEYVWEAGGHLGAGEDLLEKEEVHYGVAEHVREAPPGKNRLFFLTFFTFPEIQAD